MFRIALLLNNLFNNTTELFILSRVILMDNQQLIGERIRKARIDAGFTQDELGKKIGYSAMGVSYLEKGLRNITVDVIAKLVKELNISLQYLLEPIAGKAQIGQHASYGRTNIEFSDDDQKTIEEFEKHIKEKFGKEE